MFRVNKIRDATNALGSKESLLRGIAVAFAQFHYKALPRMVYYGLNSLNKLSTPASLRRFIVVST